MVELVTVSVPSSMLMPPPRPPVAKLSAMVELVTVTVPALSIPPPSPSESFDDGGVGERQRAVVDRRRRYVVAAVDDRVVVDGGVGDGQRARVVDADACRRRPGR